MPQLSVLTASNMLADLAAKSESPKPLSAEDVKNSLESFMAWRGDDIQTLIQDLREGCQLFGLAAAIRRALPLPKRWAGHEHCIALLRAACLGDWGEPCGFDVGKPL